MKSQKVTIVMATYNRAHFIRETLLSIQNQTFKEWECLIVDDGGTDNTLEVITPLLENDSRFKFYKRPDSYRKGLPGSRNFGLDLAKGDYIIFFDDDDIVHPQNLELCVKELMNKQVSFCRYIREVFWNDFNYDFDYSKDYSSFLINQKDVEKILKHELPLNSCAVMWRKECFEKNRFVEHLMYAEEWELYSRMISSGFVGVSVNKCLFFGRKHSNSNTGEFYRDNSVRKKSKEDAILLVIQNLKEKDLLTDSLLRYFIQFALQFKESRLFHRIVELVEMSVFKRIKWKIFYVSLPLRLSLYRIKKQLINK